MRLMVTLLNRDVVQLELFDEKISEVILENGKRYLLRRNPDRAEEIAASRKSKLQSLRDFVAKKNEYLQTAGLAPDFRFRASIATKCHR